LLIKEWQMTLDPRREWPQWAMIAGMFLLAAITWPNAPDRIPIHWNISGEIDGYAGRFGGLLALPLISAGLYLFLLIIPLVDPSGTRHPGFAAPFALMRGGTIFVMALIYAATHLLIRGVDIDMSMMVGAGIGILFVVIGSAIRRMPTEIPSALSTPWEIRDPASRQRVQEVSGRVFGASGIVIAVAGFIHPVAMFAVIIGGSIVTAGVALVLSYRVSKAEGRKRD